MDAQGDGVATAIYEGRGSKLRRLRSFGFPEHSLGHFYDCVGEWLGFKPVRDAVERYPMSPRYACPIVPAQLSGDVGLLGALALVLDPPPQRNV